MPTLSITPANETDSPNSIAILGPLSNAAETDSAQALSVTYGGQEKTLTPVTETDTANKIAILGSVAPVTQTNDAQSLSYESGVQNVSINPVVETDTARVITGATVAYRAVGAVTQTGATVGARVLHASVVQLKVATDAGLANVVAISSAVAPDSNGYVKLSVTGLTAGTQYYYGFFDNSAAVLGANGKFKTAPAGAASFEVGFGSCANADPTVSMANMEARDPDIFLDLGDLGYWDISANDESAFRSSWNSTMPRVGYKSAFGNRASAYIWSDHDYGANNSGGSSASKPAANAVYRAIFPHYALASGAATGIQQTFVWGRVRFILTDNRSFRSSNSATDNATKTMLGAAQKQWLKDTITNATEKLIIWANDVPWIGAAVAGEDDWTGFTTERAELGAFLETCGKPVIYLSGDQHCVAYDNGTNAVGGNTGSNGDGILMLCNGAPFNQGASRKGGPYSGGQYPASGSSVVQQYGYLTITDIGGDTITVDFAGYDNSDVAQVSGSKTITVAGNTLTPAFETDTANSIAIMGPTSPAAETDGAQALSIAKPIRKTLTPAVEADAAQSLTTTTKSIFAAPETDTAQTLTKSKRKTLTTATELDTAQGTRGVRGPQSISLDTETNTAQALTFTKPIKKTLTPVSESDTTQVLSVSQAHRFSIAPALETDSVGQLTHTIFRTLTPVGDTSSPQALSVTHIHYRTLTPTQQESVTQTLTRSKHATLSSATSTHTAQVIVITEDIHRSLVPVEETDQARALVVPSGDMLSPAVDPTATLAPAAITPLTLPVTHGSVAGFFSTGRQFGADERFGDTVKLVPAEED